MRNSADPVPLGSYPVRHGRTICAMTRIGNGTATGSSSGYGIRSRRRSTTGMRLQASVSNESGSRTTVPRGRFSDSTLNPSSRSWIRVLIPARRSVSSSTVCPLSRRHSVLRRLAAIIRVVRRVGAALVTIGDPAVDESFEDASGGPMWPVRFGGDPVGRPRLRQLSGGHPNSVFTRSPALQKVLGVRSVLDHTVTFGPYLNVNRGRQFYIG